VDRWNDCTQEVFRRLLERVEPEGWNGLLQSEGEDRREFLRAIDAVKKRTQRDQKRFTALATVVPDGRENGVHAQDREAVNQAAHELLTSRQQRILQLSFEGWSVHDMASALKLAPERISDEKYKAIRKLRDHFCAAERCS
jgi:RNA polymerase sigma factor (sigma-70 family)